MKVASNHAGFSLLELMIVVSIAAVLASIAVPSFRSFTLNSQRAAAVNDLTASLQLARSEATKLGQRVVVCPTASSGSACAGSDSWSQGWLVFVDNDKDSVIDSTERTLQVGVQSSASITVTASASSFAFKPFGNSATNGNFKFCDPRGGGHAKSIIVSPSGRVRLSDVDSGGNALVCS